MSERTARNEARSVAAIDESSIKRPRIRRRKRTALALGVSTVGLAATSNLALAADPILAQGLLELFEDETIAPVADILQRVDAGTLTVSDELLAAMVEEEGVRYDVYRDVAGYPTVGVGHLVLPEDGLSLGDTITHERAMALLEQDLKKAENGVRELVKDLPINQHEFDALVDLVFNVGRGTVSADSSPRLNAAIENADYDGIAEELEYTTAKNKVAKGLVFRSERRSQIFMNADYSDPRATVAQAG